MKANAEMFKLDGPETFVGEANRRLFERECRQAGIDPAGGVSPSLRKKLFQPTEAPKIILAYGPAAGPDAIVIDMRAKCFWRGPDRSPYPSWSNVKFRLHAALLLSGPRVCENEDLFEFVWGDDPSGGPEDLHNTIHVQFRNKAGHHLQQWLGGRVVNSWGRGFRFEFGTWGEAA